MIGGGLPVGAFGGRAEIMDHLSPDGPVYQAGTLSGNPLAMAAGLAQLRELERINGWALLEQLGAQLEESMREPCFAIDDRRSRFTASDRCSACSLLGPVTDLATAKTSDRDAFARIFPSLSRRRRLLRTVAIRSRVSSRPRTRLRDLEKTAADGARRPALHARCPLLARSAISFAK